MREWLKISIILCLVGFFFGMVPSDHFMFQYLTQYRDIPEEAVTSFFYPQFAYWNAGLLILFLLITDMLRYKPVIILSTLAGISYHATLQWTQGLNALIATTFSIGLMGATGIAYSTYLYAKVDRDKYQQVTSHTRSAMLFGRCTGAIMSQFLMMYDVMNPKQMIYISIGNKCAAFILALLLPSVSTSIYFYQAKKKKEVPTLEALSLGDQKTNLTLAVLPESLSDKELVEFSWKGAKSLIRSHLKSAYTNKTVVLWSIFWALLHVGFMLAYAYNQPLWHFIEPDREDIFNGFAEFGLTLFGALAALLTAKLNQEFLEKWAVWIMALGSMVMGALCIICGNTTNVFVSYAMYIALGACYYFLLTMTSALVAKHLVMDSFALIFGLNGWFGAVGEFIFSLIVISDTFFSFNPRELYTIFGCYFLVLVIVFASYGIVNVIRQRGRSKLVAD